MEIKDIGRAIHLLLENTVPGPREAVQVLLAELVVIAANPENMSRPDSTLESRKETIIGLIEDAFDALKKAYPEWK